MANETALRKYVAALIRGDVSQIESHATSPGIPDTNYCISGAEGWIELKNSAGGKNFVVRDTQKVWFRKRIRAGASRLFIFWRHEIDGQREHGIIRVSQANVEWVFSNSSVASWRGASLCTWGQSVLADHLNTILEWKHD